MKYVALLSGGKDSCFNLVHCSLNGHELVAAASLRPQIGKEELDSYLYQTVGQDAIVFVAHALEIPLYRQVIHGTAIEQGSEYGCRTSDDAGGTPGDETEDLFVLLSTVKDHHPLIEGVAVGAILSNYQRVRVEHVCRRLGLTTLCYLWQRNQANLMSEMIAAGMESILIKVAGIGLTQSHLGKTLAQMQPTLENLHAKYGSHICGEGGEYETLTLDCPLFKHRIALTDVETVIHSDHDFATVAFLRIKGAQLEAKSAEKATVVYAPPLLHDEYLGVCEVVLKSQQADSITPQTQIESSSFRHAKLPLVRSRQVGPWVCISNVQSPSEGTTLQDEVTGCFKLLIECLFHHNLRLSNCAIINICISSIDLFQDVNAMYSTFFGVSPPARACVGVDLPEGTRILLECIAFAERTPLDRQALHVQGLSYWAPANIGPYSQVITVGERVFISGQIGLIPSTLVMPSTSLGIEMALSSQHISSITTALKENTGGNWEGHTMTNIYWFTSPCSLPHMKKGHLALKASQSPTIFLQVKELPRNALVEKQVYIHTGRVKGIDEDGDEFIQNVIPLFHEDELRVDDQCVLKWEVSKLEDGTSDALVFLKSGFRRETWNTHSVVVALSKHMGSALSARYFYLPGGEELVVDMASLIFAGNVPPITPIPCRRISSLHGDGWDAAFCVISASSGMQMTEPVLRCLKLDKILAG